MRIAVCDDSREDALALKKQLCGHEVRIYAGAGSLLADIEEKKIRFDLYLLDIFMEDSMDGIELAGKLRGRHEDAVICFVSTSSDFYREAYDLYAIQYLVKPVQEESLQKLVGKVQKNLVRRKEKTLRYSRRGETGTIPYSKIRYISSMGHTILIHCVDGKVQEAAGKLKDIEDQVRGDTFMRCHQSFIVNMRFVEGQNGMNLVVAGESIPMSRRYAAEVKKRYREMLFEEVDW